MVESETTAATTHEADDLLDGLELTVEVDPEIADLVPMFLDNRRKEVAQLRDAFRTDDLETVEDIAHGMKGMGAAYGFEPITEIGATLERMAREARTDGMERRIEALDRYLERVEVA